MPHGTRQTARRSRSPPLCRRTGRKAEPSAAFNSTTQIVEYPQPGNVAPGAYLRPGVDRAAF